MTEQDLAAIFEAQANIRGMAEHGRPQNPETQLRFFGQLQRAREIIEAHASTGRPFPGSVKDFAAYLQELAVPSWPGYTAVPGTAAGFQREAEWIVEAVLGSSPASGQEPAQIPASTPAATPNTIQHLNTEKNEQEQRRIFAALVEAGFIAGADAAGASMLQPFLNAFDPEAREQGRIIWTGTPLRGGAAGKPSPTQALDFVALMAGGVLSGIDPAFARGAFPAIFQGLICSDDTRGEFTKKWNKGGGSEYHNRLAAIISLIISPR